MAMQTAQTDEEWERARIRYEVAAAEVAHTRAELRAEARTQMAVEPISSIRSVRRQMDEQILPPVEPRPWGAPEPRAGWRSPAR